MSADEIIKELLEQIDAVTVEDLDRKIRIVEVKPHGRDCPSRCSICLGVPARRVEQQGPDLLVDGEPLRPIAPPADPCLQQPRGQRRRRPRK